MKNTILLLGLIFAVTALKAQIKWGKVDPAHWAVKACPIDSSASAMVELDSEYVSFTYDQFGINAVYDVYRRIRIFNKDGFQYGTVKIPYFSHLNSQTFDMLKAQTITMDDEGKIRITPVKNDAIFDEASNEYFSVKKFAFADVQEGSVLEYKYTLVSRGISSLHDWFFQTEIPVLRSAIELKIPDFIHYTPTPMGPVMICNYKSEPFDDGNIHGTVVHYAMKNVAAMKEEPFITTMNDYRARLSFPISSITLPMRKQIVFGENWDNVAQEFMHNQNFGGHLNEMIGDQITAAKSITKDVTGANNIISAIYKHVTGKMKWNKHTGVYATQRLSKSYTDGTGNSADINLVLISMLRAAGIKADPVLISTRKHGAVQKAYPASRQFDNVIAVAQLDSGTMLLDAVSPLWPADLIGTDNLNYQGMRIISTGDSYSAVWIDIPATANSTASLMATIKLDSAGNMKGQYVLTATDYTALNFRNRLITETVKDCLQKQLSIQAEADLKNESVENEKDPTKRLKFNFEVVKAAEGGGSKIVYFNPFAVRFLGENPLKAAKRIFPVDFGYGFQQNMMTTVMLPDNYKVTELPKPVNLVLADGSATFTFLVGQVGNNVQIKSSFKINSSRYLPDVYSDLQAIYTKMLDTYNGVIVLEKSN